MSPLRRVVAANNGAMSEADQGARERARPDVAKRWLRPGAAFFGALLARPELALVAESCPAERRLHDRLTRQPTSPASAAELAAMADDDARENYATFLSFRDAVLDAGSVEAWYL